MIPLSVQHHLSVLLMFNPNQDFRLGSSTGTKHNIFFQRHPTVDIIFVFWVEMYAGLGYIKEETQLSSLYLVSAVGTDILYSKHQWLYISKEWK